MDERVPCICPFTLGKHHDNVFRVRNGLSLVVIDAIAECIGNCHCGPSYGVNMDKIELGFGTVGDQVDHKLPEYRSVALLTF